MATSIYVLADPRVTDPVLRIRYVGLTREAIERRLERHMSVAHSMKTYRDRWIAGLARLGFTPTVERYAQVSQEHAAAAEVGAISLLRMLGARLTNLTIGGDGVIGHVHSEATRQRLREAHTGRTLPEEQKARIGAGLRRAYSEGRHKTPDAPTHMWTPEVGAKISASLRGRLVPADRRARIAATLTGRRDSAITRANKSAGQQRRNLRRMPNNNGGLF